MKLKLESAKTKSIGLLSLFLLFTVAYWTWSQLLPASTLLQMTFAASVVGCLILIDVRAKRLHPEQRSFSENQTIIWLCLIGLLGGTVSPLVIKWVSG